MRPGAIIAVAGLVALAPAAAQAKTKSVTLGLTAKQAQAFHVSAAGTDVNDFFPHGVKIHVGDKVKFIPGGFHTVQFPPKGQDPAGLIVPTGAMVSGVNDSLNTPFWFNGAPEFNFNPAVFTPIWGTKVTFNANKGLESGPTFIPKPLTVRFKKTGKFTYFCNVHPGMTGSVTVVKKSKKIPSPKADRKTVSKAVARDLKIAKKLTTATVPAGTIDVGEAGAHGVEYFGMLPATLTVPVGTTLDFRMSALSLEAHTATFGPGNPDTDKTSYLGKIAASFESTSLDQRGVFPSQPPGTTATLTPALHGNGFWNSGVMDAVAASPPASHNAVTFGTPGTYDYYCMIHPFMHGLIKVQ
jgi:plastocyanin